MVEAIADAALPPLLELFYDRVRRDAELGPVFDSAVHDWPAHLQRLAAFWSSVMLTSGRYKGNPMLMHLKHGDIITDAMFARWLVIWQETTDELLPASAALAMQAKAQRIAERLQIALKIYSIPKNPITSSALADADASRLLRDDACPDGRLSPLPIRGHS
ncbi:MAG: group III truncated hemoglobin [Rhodospirillales bacterium]|nr:group III truncated hemoglobin [Rhodospirillales bacterium]